MKQELSLMAAAVMLGGALLLSTGCAKESSVNEKYRPAGAEISFSASTGYENGSGTRTEYSGVLSGTSPKYERIDWVSGDKVAIAYVHGSISKASDYVVTTIDETSGRNSVASVAAVSDQQKLTWDSGSGDHVFYAMYPANGFEDNTSASLTTAGHVSATIPATQTFHENRGKYLPPMEYGYMFSYKKIEGDSHESRVTLPFTPAVTTFEFQLQRGADEPNASVTGVRLSASTALTGTFEFDITGGDANGATWGTVSTSGTGNTITVNFASAVTLPAHGAETYLDFTLFALPVEQTGLTLKLLYSNGTSKSLSLTNGTFAAGKKHIITNTSVPGGNWEYHIGNLSPITVSYGGSSAATLASGFTSYRTDGTTSQAVPFILEYSATGADGTWSTGNKPAWLTPSGNFNGSTTGQTLTMNVTAQSPTSSSPHREAMLVKGNGTLGADFDLSRRNWGTGGTTTNSPGWTANCYIVDRPGTYKFPLVYGNSFNNGSLNEGAFRGNWRESGYWYRYGYIHNSTEIYIGSFRDHREDQNGNVYLITEALHTGAASTNDVYLTKFGSLSAELVWSDVPNLITSVAISGNYCTFSVPQEYIDQGNALIVVKSGGTIIWSWHIWVTDQMTSSSSFAPVNLGYCDGIKTTIYPERTYYVRARQNVTGGQTSLPVLVKENSYNAGNTSGSPYNTYYQWGRKDPFLPGYYATDNSLNSATPGTSIKNPTTYYNRADSWCAAYYYKMDGNRDGDEGWKYPLNLWNSRTANTYSDHDYNSADYEVYKTVYDPCPSGYKVPNIEKFISSSINSPSLGVLTDTSSGACFYSATAYDWQGACYWNGSSVQTCFRKAALPIRPYRE